MPLCFTYFVDAMRLLFLLLLFFSTCFSATAQNSGSLLFKILNGNKAPVANATVELLRSKDSLLTKVALSDTTGTVRIYNLANDSYLLRISSTGYAMHITPPFIINNVTELPSVFLNTTTQTLQGVTVEARKPFIEMRPDKTVVNMEAGITQVGATALEALEKLPGVTVDKDGNISLKGKSGVLVLIDDKQTYLDAAQLSSLLSGMSAAQISQVEIMDQPSARYDAAGNAGIINIRIKKTKQVGFNGSLNLAYSQGIYPKSNNSLQLNYRTGKFNHFLSYSFNINQSFTRIYALRRYFEADGETVATQLEQPTFFKGAGHLHNLRIGSDYALSSKTTIGYSLNGVLQNRNTTGGNTALWMNAQGKEDSLISTQSQSTAQIENAAGNINFKHQFSAGKELTADIDVLQYGIASTQMFENYLVFPTTYTEASRAYIPSNINIVSGKADYSQQIGTTKLEGGWKSSRITTNNKAEYDYLDGAQWKPDLDKTNHFLYNENIHAVYGSAQTQLGRWAVQGGLRYEMTNYDAEQLGNDLRKDSSFSRSYNSLFPTLFATYEADSSHQFSISAGRRIDRPAFQKLNPFLFIINKYTYQQGNPFIKPQYTWNLQFNHIYKDILTTGINYSYTKDYFSQIFPVDNTGIVLYTEGNIGRMQQWGASAGLQLSPLKWWSFNAQGVVNYKKLEGFIWRTYNASIIQFTINMAHQLKFKRGWSGELSGFYNSRSQQDLQEILDPSGQVSAGVAKTLWNNKATVKFAVRDIFYTQWMKGLTYFDGADEYFKLTRDSRVGTLSFTWRFGNGSRTTRRATGSAGEEIERVNSGN